jgi:hypothetical protein
MESSRNGERTIDGELSAEEIDDMVESEREWKEGLGRRFKDAKSAIEWLNDSACSSSPA